MNVVPVHAPNTLPIIFERGLIGVYHDWCESFGSYPRSYDLLHADHLFSRLKSNRCDKHFKLHSTVHLNSDYHLRKISFFILQSGSCLYISPTIIKFWQVLHMNSKIVCRISHFLGSTVHHVRDILDSEVLNPKQGYFFLFLFVSLHVILLNKSFLPEFVKYFVMLYLSLSLSDASKQ